VRCMTDWLTIAKVAADLFSEEFFRGLQQGELVLSSSVVETALRSQLPASVTLEKLMVQPPARFIIAGTAQTPVQTRFQLPIDIVGLRLTRDPAYVHYVVGKEEACIEGLGLGGRIVLAIVKPVLRLVVSKDPIDIAETKLAGIIGARRTEEGFLLDLRTIDAVRTELDRCVAGVQVWELVEIDGLQCTDRAVVLSLSETTRERFGKMRGWVSKTHDVLRRGLDRFWKQQGARTEKKGSSSD
jgi:hypothetical protein